MTDEPSQLPWHLEGKCIYTAHGDFIGEMEHADDARLVVDAVNHIEETKRLSIKLYDPIRRAEAERDRLRDIVRRFLDLFTPGMIHPAGTMERLLRKARAAIGEEEE